MPERTPEQVRQDLEDALARRQGYVRVHAQEPAWLIKEEKLTFSHIPQTEVDSWLDKNRSSLSFKDSYKRG